MEPAWSCYRLIAEKMATFTEVTTMMSIDDVEILCDVSDVVNAPLPGQGGGK